MLGLRKAGRALVGIGAAVALFQATAAPAGATLPYGEGFYAKVDGALSIPVVILEDAAHVFPTGGPGACDPGGHQPNLTGKVSQPNRKGKASVTDVEYDYAAGDVWVQEDGVICGKLSITSHRGQLGPNRRGGEQTPFTLKNVKAELGIIGHGVFAQHIPEGCSLSLKIGTLSGKMAEYGPPNAAKLSAEKIHIAKASPDKCGEAYSHLLNVGFGLPAKHGSLSLDLTVHWGPSQGGTPTTNPPTTNPPTTAVPTTTTPLPPTTTAPPTTTTVPATTTTDGHEHSH